MIKFVAMSKTRILVHIVFSTKYRQPTISLNHKRRLYAYIHGIIQKYRCKTLRINGLADHVHILLDLHPSVALAILVKEIKQSTSLWMKNENDFRKFTGWNEGYYAASIGSNEEGACVQYIMNQDASHGEKDFITEIKLLAMEYRLDWDECDWSATPRGVDSP